MKKIPYLILFLISCKTTQPGKPLGTHIDILPYGQSRVTNEYKDSTTIVNLTHLGEKISDTTILK